MTAKRSTCSYGGTRRGQGSPEEVPGLLGASGKASWR